MKRFDKKELDAVNDVIKNGDYLSGFTTKFRGGDGVSTLAGISTAIAPYAVLPAFFISGIIVILISRITLHPSLWAGMAGYSIFVLLSFFEKTNVEITLVLGITLMFIAVLTHSIIFHKRHKEYFNIAGGKN